MTEWNSLEVAAVRFAVDDDYASRIVYHRLCGVARHHGDTPSRSLLSTPSDPQLLPEFGQLDVVSYGRTFIIS
jgi:hypothetical protein